MTVALRMVPTPTAVRTLTLAGLTDDYVGSDLNASDGEIIAAQEATDTVVALATAHTRGQGFSADGQTCSEDIAAVIASAALRLYSNPTGLRREEIGGWSSVPGVWAGWLLPEVLVLNSWRRRTA